jgi:hypothetical protein
MGGRLPYDFHQRLAEIARDFRQTWLAKIDDTTESIRQALDRAWSQKQASAQATAARMRQLDNHLMAILQAEPQLLSLKQQVEAALYGERPGGYSMVKIIIET